jgi:hypothetical protein
MSPSIESCGHTEIVLSYGSALFNGFQKAFDPLMLSRIEGFRENDWPNQPTAEPKGSVADCLIHHMIVTIMITVAGLPTEKRRTRGRENVNKEWKLQ